MPFAPSLKRAAAAASLVVGLATTTLAAAPAGADTPSTSGGRQLTVAEAVQAAYDGGFRGEEQLLTVTAIAVAESSLRTGLRNWHPELGDGAADRGLYQINSYHWPQYSDATVDDPAQAARVVHQISAGGTDFSPWHTYTSGEAQRHFDAPYNGWPALRPVVRDVLAGGVGASGGVQAAGVGAPARPAGEVHQVLGHGGTLYKLAIQHYGDGDLWPVIAARNGVLVPEHLLAEQVIIIP